MTKPIIVFYEPYEILVKEDGKKEEYLHQKIIQKVTIDELLKTFDIDYPSFFNSNIRDEKGIPENLTSEEDVNNLILNYLNVDINFNVPVVKTIVLNTPEGCLRANSIRKRLVDEGNQLLPEALYPNEIRISYMEKVNKDSKNYVNLITTKNGCSSLFFMN